MAGRKEKKRKYTTSQEKQIIRIRHKLAKQNFFYGARAIKQKLSDHLSLNFIKTTLHKFHLSHRHFKRRPGVSRYLLYPQTLINNLGTKLCQIDFIGPRYLQGSSQPLHFLSIKYVKPQKLHLFYRIDAATTSEVLRVLYQFWSWYPLPDVVQMDNGSQFRGFTKRTHSVGRLIRWLCALGIIPIFNAPNSPWNNASVEGGNSVFDRKFWRHFRFKTRAEVDKKLTDFNCSYQAYLQPERRSQIKTKRKSIITPTLAKRLNFSTQSKVYFIRRVKEHYGKYQVEILNDHIFLPACYNDQFVLIELKLRRQTIKIFQEIKKQRILRHKSSFYLHL